MCRNRGCPRTTLRAPWRSYAARRRLAGQVAHGLAEGEYVSHEHPEALGACEGLHGDVAQRLELQWQRPVVTDVLDRLIVVFLCCHGDQPGDEVRHGACQEHDEYRPALHDAVGDRLLVVEVDAGE